MMFDECCKCCINCGDGCGVCIFVFDIILFFMCCFGLVCLFIRFLNVLYFEKDNSCCSFRRIGCMDGC